MRSSGTRLLLFVLSTLATAAPVRGAPAARSRVAVVRSSPDDPLLREANTRLRAELAGAGFEVVEVDQAPGDSRAGVEGASAQARSYATVSIERAGTGALADVWISDTVTGKTVVRRLSVGGTRSAANVLAIRAMELLRASLLEIAVAKPPSEAPRAPAPADVRRWVEPAITERRGEGALSGSRLSVGALAVHGFDGIGPAIGPSARFSAGLGDHPFLRLSAAAPLVAGDVAAAAGTATVTQYFLSLDLGWATPARPIGAFGWAGLGAYYLRTEGAASPPYRGTSAEVLSFLASAGVGGVARLGPGVAFTAELAILGLLPHPAVVIGEREVGTVGAPSATASLALMVEL